MAEFNIGNQQAQNIYQGDQIHIHGTSGPPEDVMAVGQRCLDQGNYEAARAAFEKAVLDPKTEIQANFHLAVSLLAENRLRLKKERTIRRAEAALERILKRARNDPGALILSAIINEGYYQANRYRSPAHLLELPQPYADGAEEQIALIVEHVRAEESPTWRLLSAKTGETA